MTTPTIPTGCTGYYVAQLGRIHHDGDTCPIHEADELTRCPRCRAEHTVASTDLHDALHCYPLPAIVTGPLWVRRYDEARRAEMIGDEHTGRVSPWTPSDVIA